MQASIGNYVYTIVNKNEPLVKLKALGFKVGFAIVTPDVGSEKHVQPVCWPKDGEIQVLPVTQNKFDDMYLYILGTAGPMKMLISRKRYLHFMTKPT